MENKPCTHYVVQDAMKAVSIHVRKPKCVRDGIVKDIKTEKHGK